MKHLYAKVADAFGCDVNEAHAMVNKFISIISDELLDSELINFHGFGKFIIKPSISPTNGDVYKKILFKPSISLKNKLKEGDN